MVLTEAQRTYLEMAARDDGLSCDAISPGSSYRCVRRLVDADLLEDRFVAGHGTTYFTTANGLQALGCQL